MWDARERRSGVATPEQMGRGREQIRCPQAGHSEPLPRRQQDTGDVAGECDQLTWLGGQISVISHRA